jgi:hypothetical protein
MDFESERAKINRTKVERKLSSTRAARTGLIKLFITIATFLTRRLMADIFCHA